MEQRPNFYIILELDPSVTDWETIEAAIQSKKKKWSQESAMGNPAARRKAQRNLGFTKDLFAVLQDQEAREAEANQARKILKAEVGEHEKELGEALDLLKAVGHCTSKQLDRLVSQYQKVFSKKEIEARIRKRGIKLDEDSAKPEKHEKPLIHDVTAQNIKRNLDILNIPDLYTFLDLNFRSSPQLLFEKADEIYRELQRIGKTDAEHSAKSELAGFCKATFRDDNEKEKYDNYLENAKMRAFNNRIEIMGADGVITHVDLDSFIRQTRLAGVRPEIASDYILQYAAKRKWRVVKDQPLSSVELLQCGFCNELVDPQKATHCTKCSEPLIIDCPQCGAKTPTQNTACGSCGCRTGDAPVVKSLLEQGKRLMIDGKHQEAIQHFDRALLYWPNWREADTAKRLAETKLREHSDLFNQLQTLVREKKLLSARDVFNRIGKEDKDSHFQSLKKDIESGIENAEAIFQKGEEARQGNHFEMAVERYEAALAHCADFESAKKALAAFPPGVPENLRVHELATGFQLAWNRVASKGDLKYRIIRKANGTPHNDSDGVTVAEISGVNYEELRVETGIPWYYSVYAIRNGIPSREGCVSGPHFIAADVSDLELFSGDGSISLNWNTPAGCKEVEIWRKRGATPQKPGDGEKISATDKSCHDTNLENGTLYEYLLIAVYDDPRRKGSLLKSRGIRVSGKPELPPPPVKDLRAVRRGDTVELFWTEGPGQTTVQIRQSIQDPGLETGRLIHVKQADRLGGLLPAIAPGRTICDMPRQGRLFFVPLTVISNLAVVGNTESLSSMEEVGMPEIQRSSRSLLLTWNWPENASEVLIAYSKNDFPKSPNDANISKTVISRDDYLQKGGWEYVTVDPVCPYFTLFIKNPHGDQYSKGVSVHETTHKIITVPYRVVRKKRLMLGPVKEAWIEFKSRQCKRLEELVVVGNLRRVPVSVESGIQLVEASDVRFTDGLARLPIPERHLGKGYYIKVFFKDSNQAAKVRLLPARQDQLLV